ncbi:MAG: hypothetical protein AUG06_11145 [Actinobacteria bacterium 13_1_20CM_2_65_11]|nr:MAG: hypothetical protein AUH69_11655 [Actinobacteria bacterium 13_1_40CM_4_65_12]OLD49143.1 MAG: hypothetical protein AUI42_09220 [Actinobacteria bacterium 13_1_40CM_2_65_8]OLE78228.1 MAG: hypothetical protein AUG06_11145 [Actinobacteria bacterium 13_1_20CM_2_65_11]
MSSWQTVFEALMTDKSDIRLRSLERESMYSIFAPLDANEPLPRELVKEGRRYKTLGRRELAGALWLPAMATVLVLASWGGIHGVVVLGIILFMLLVFVVFVVSGERKARLK